MREHKLLAEAGLNEEKGKLRKEPTSELGKEGSVKRAGGGYQEEPPGKGFEGAKAP